MTGENAPTTVTTGFDRLGDWLFSKGKTATKRLAAETVPGATLIPAVRRQVEADEQKRFDDWYRNLPDERKTRFREVFIEPGLWAPGQWEAVVFREFRDMPGGPREQAISRAMATVPGMITRGNTLPRSSVAKAEEMLAGRKWTELSRPEKLAIKKATGLERVTGGYDEWVKETPTDPQLNSRLQKRISDWAKPPEPPMETGDIVKDTIAFKKYIKENADKPPFDPYKGGHVAPLDRVFKDNGSGFMKSLGDKASETDLIVTGSKTPFGMKTTGGGAAGAYSSSENALVLTERVADSDLIYSVPRHELQHVEQPIDPRHLKLPYSSQPHEIEASIVGARWNVPAEERAATLLEDSHPGLKSWGPDFYDEVLKDQRMLQQDAKGGVATHAAEKSQDDTAHEESTAPTDEQLQEAVEFLETVMEIGAPQNQWEQQAVKRIHDVLVETLKSSQRTDTADQPAPRSETVRR